MVRALDAQVAGERWEAAARAAYLLGEWVDRNHADVERADATYRAGSEYAGRVGYVPIASLLAYRQAYRLLATGRASDALGFTGAALQRAEQAGDALGRALLLERHGDARLTTGDAAGVAEMTEAAEILAEHSHPLVAITYNNLAEALVALGELAEAREARRIARTWAERLGDAMSIEWTACVLADSDYQSGDWPAALETTAGLVAASGPFVAMHARLTRGRIALACGVLDDAHEHANAIREYAAATGSDEFLLAAYALLGRVHHASGNQSGAADAARRFLDRWNVIGGMPNVAPSLAELTLIPDSADGLAGAVELLPDASRWKQAVRAIVEARYADAATLYGRIGSLPLEADAHLLAAAEHRRSGRIGHATAHAQQALAFYRQVDAALGIAEAQELSEETA